MPDDTRQRQLDSRMKHGLLTVAIAGGLLVAPACGTAQAQLVVTATIGGDLGGGVVKTFENGGVVSLDFGLPLEDTAHSSTGSLAYGDIGGGFRSGPIVFAGMLGLAVFEEHCINGGGCFRSWGYREPERWHPVGFRAGVGAMVFAWKDITLGAKAIRGHQGGRYSAWVGFVLENGERKGRTD